MQNSDGETSSHVLQTPLWVNILRGFQLLLSFIIMVMCAYLIHGAYIAEEGFNIALWVLTWLVLAYTLLSEKIPSLHGLYHIIAVIVLDGWLMIMWLAGWASMAAMRATFVVPVSVSNCVDDGSSVNAIHCQVGKRDLHKRFVTMGPRALAMTAVIPAIGAIIWVMFIAIFVWELISFLRGRKEGRFPITTGGDYSGNTGAQLESKIPEAQPMQPQQPQAFVQTQQPVPAYNDAQQYQQPIQQAPPSQYPPQGQAPYQPAQSPYQQQQAMYPPPQNAYPPQPVQPQMTGHSQPVSYGSELDGHNQFSTPPPVSPPPGQYQQHYGPPQ